MKPCCLQVRLPGYRIYFNLRFESIEVNIKQKEHLKQMLFGGRGIRIRTLNNGVRVRCVTVTLYLCIDVLNCIVLAEV